MARIRSIKPEMWASEKLGRMTLLARLTFIGLISLADDEGRGRGDPRYLCGALHGYTCDIKDDDFDASLKELEAKRLVAFYEVDEGHYYALPGWGEHQYIEKRGSSKFPAVPDSHPMSVLWFPTKEGSGRGAVGEEKGRSMVRIGREGKGEDRKGKDICASRHKFTPPTVEEVTAYCRERANQVNAVRFVAYYESKGWVVGRSPMKDWKAAVRQWETNSFCDKPKRIVGDAAPKPGEYGHLGQ